MGQLVTDDFLVEGAITEGTGLVENKHVTVTWSTIGRGLERGIVRVANIRTGLNKTNNSILSQAAAIEIGSLVIAGSFSEAELVKSIVVPVSSVKQLNG